VSAAGSRLIVNADDFGLSEAIDDGIVEAHRDGIVTCASVIVNAPAFAHAVAAAKANPGLDLGVHLTLTELAPVCAAPTVPSLVGADGRFAAHAIAFAARYLRGSVRLPEVRRELDAQIRRALDAGLTISHLDSHQHVHVLPGIARVVAELAAEHGIGAVRYPRERLQPYMLERGVCQARRLIEQAGLNLACALSPLRRLRHPDRFLGFHCGGRLSDGRLAALLRHLPGRGTFELMCHPAQAESGGPQAQWGYDGAAERAALTSARIRELLRERRIALVGYRDL
jgi:hopanoid biosynthesis associated protein HpnK